MASRGDLNPSDIQPTLLDKWVTIEFEKSICRPAGVTKLKASQFYSSGTYPVVDQGDKFIAGYVNDSSLLYEGNLPVVIFGDHTRNVKYIDFEFAIGADGTKILPPQKGFNPRFFYYYLKSLKIPNLGYSRHYKLLKQVIVPLPPLPEQQRIVAKLDTVFASLDQVKARMEKIPELLKQFRQSVLTQAVTGKLTEEWREGKELEWRFELAESCCYKVQSGGTPKGSAFATSGIPFFKVYNIVEQEISFEYRPQFVSEEIQNSQCKKSICYPGDVLMNIVGPPLNKVAIIPERFKESNINQAITLFRVKDYLSNKFLYYFLCEGSSVRSLVNETRGVVGQVNISLSQCRALVIPIPSLPEQTEIVNRVEALFSKADRIQEKYEALKAQIDMLPQAVLAKAFKGELVEQLPTDGDARELLKEIAELKQSTKKGKK